MKFDININLNVSFVGPFLHFVEELFENSKRILFNMAALDDKITALQAQVTAETSADNAAETLLTQLNALLQQALNSAANAGATDAQLAEIQAVSDSIGANAGTLAAAVAANTPLGPVIANLTGNTTVANLTGASLPQVSTTITG